MSPLSGPGTRGALSPSPPFMADTSQYLPQSRDGECPLWARDGLLCDLHSLGQSHSSGHHLYVDHTCLCISGPELSLGHRLPAPAAS